MRRGDRSEPQIWQTDSWWRTSGTRLVGDGRTPGSQNVDTVDCIRNSWMHSPSPKSTLSMKINGFNPVSVFRIMMQDQWPYMWHVNWKCQCELEKAHRFHIVHQKPKQTGSYIEAPLFSSACLVFSVKEPTTCSAVFSSISVLQPACLSFSFPLNLLERWSDFLSPRGSPQSFRCVAWRWLS